MILPPIRKLKPKLNKFLKQFDDCFPRKDTRAHLPIYITGQLSDIPEKSVEPIALNAGVAPRTLQEFLSQHHWDHDLLRDQLQHIVRDQHSGPHSIGIIDETSDVKKGDKTPGVQRQWCGSVGKKENCLVTVHLGYARDDFHCLLDGELYLPECWSADRPRCREAGIPDDMVCRPKWQIALELYDQALKNGRHFDWMTFDEGYGSKPDFLRGLDSRDQKFVGEVPRSFTGWLKPPRVITRPYHKNGRGRGRKVPRLASGSRPARRVEELLEERAFVDQAWQRWRVKDGEKGPMIGEVKHALFTPKDEDGLPGEPMHLVVARERPGPQGGEVFREQCSSGYAGAEPIVGGVLAVASRTLFRGSEERDRTGPVRRPSLSGIETPPDPELRELPVPVADARGVRGGKIGSGPSARCTQRSRP